VNGEPICPCEGFAHPRVVVNPPGRASLAYRVGDFTTFRHALVLPKAGERELVHWRPTATGDLALQMVEWWAYLADILTFYMERVANEDYLRTAQLPESVARLVRTLGYRPRPGIAGTGVVAALATGPRPFTVPHGFQIQSKPGPGKEPQIFEVDADTAVVAPDAIAVDPAPDPALLTGDTVLLKGAITAVTPADEVLLLERTWPATSARYAIATVRSVQTEKDPRGKPNTRVTFMAAVTLRSGVATTSQAANAVDFRLLRSTQTVHLWPYASATTVISTTTAHLDGVARPIRAGDPVLVESSTISPGARLLRCTATTELVWYANASQGTPQTPPPAPATPIPLLHTQIDVTSDLSSTEATTLNTNRASVVVRYDWHDVGQPIPTPRATVSTSSALSLVALPPAHFPPMTSVPVLVEDAAGVGASGAATNAGGPSATVDDLLPAGLTLTAPLRMLFTRIPVSRGSTVAGEVIGSGDATQAAQAFVLQKAPVTYLPGGPLSGTSYRTTVRVWVSGVEWREVASFYGHAPDAPVFVTREGVDGKTRVEFGDGVQGALLPTGINNVVARYRYGSGADAPEAGALTVIVDPLPDLKAIRNPVPVGGGADPDPPDHIRRYAPRSVLTFDRAVSGDDYATIAAQSPGVARARAYWAWGADEQRTVVAIYVGDDAAAVAAARLALMRAHDPNRPVTVKPATKVPIALQLSLRIDPARVAADVVAAVRAALLDPERGLFGTQATRVGQVIYRSRIYEACLGVPGVLAVHGLDVRTGSPLTAVAGVRYDPGEGGFFVVDAGDVIVQPEG